MSSIGLNVQQEIDNVIIESGQVSRDKVVDIVRTLLDEKSTLLVSNTYLNPVV